ncbi:hypothetical protein, partial [Anaplasma bovis]|uniref:hypothetical protein n=1 Tax=Anaplasma bovis TaxID=186733 RepID=UPI002FF24C14
VIVAAMHACVYFSNLVSYVQRALYRRKGTSKADPTDCCSAGYEMGLVNNNFTEFADEAMDEPNKENPSKGSEVSEGSDWESIHFPTNAEIFLWTYVDNGAKVLISTRKQGLKILLIELESIGSKRIVRKLRFAGTGLGDHCTHESAANSQECPSLDLEYSNDVTLREGAEVSSATTDLNFFSGKLGAGIPSTRLSSVDSVRGAAVYETALSA